MRVAFFGTPEFAVPSLTRLLEEGMDVRLVITQPDRPVGRSSRPVPSPVAELAAAKGLPVSKPERLRRSAEFLRELAAIGPDVAVVVAYGMILPREILDVPRLGCVNVHASLLPRHRGASPVQAAILAGDRETGVVTMRMEEGLDTGPIYLVRRVPIGEAEDAGSLSRRLASEGAGLLVETLRGLAAGRLAPRPQEGEPSFCRQISREDGEIDWSLPAPEILRRLRAFTPWPGLFTDLAGERVKLLEAETGPGGRREREGAIWIDGGEAFAAAGSATSLRLVRVQRAGRTPVHGAEFARGMALPARFGPKAAR